VNLTGDIERTGKRENLVYLNPLSWDSSVKNVSKDSQYFVEIVGLSVSSLLIQERVYRFAPNLACLPRKRT
jgi:hypothetical protein